VRLYGSLGIGDDGEANWGGMVAGDGEGLGVGIYDLIIGHFYIIRFFIKQYAI